MNIYSSYKLCLSLQFLFVDFDPSGWEINAAKMELTTHFVWRKDGLYCLIILGRVLGTILSHK